MIYTKSGAGRILNIDPKNIVSLTEEWIGIRVHIFSVGSKIISKKKFVEDFVNFRKENSKYLKLKQIKLDLFEVESASRNVHTVKLLDKQPICTCHDFVKQSQNFHPDATKCCKHIYRVLNELNYTSLDEYIKDKAKANVA